MFDDHDKIFNEPSNDFSRPNTARSSKTSFITAVSGDENEGTLTSSLNKESLQDKLGAFYRPQLSFLCWSAGLQRIVWKILSK